jgi:hypothetical protein
MGPPFTSNCGVWASFFSTCPGLFGLLLFCSTGLLLYQELWVVVPPLYQERWTIGAAPRPELWAVRLLLYQELWGHWGLLLWGLSTQSSPMAMTLGGQRSPNSGRVSSLWETQ